MNDTTKDLIVALDIGTSKVVAMIAEVLPNNAFNVIGIGHHPSRGMRRGMVVNIEETIQTIQYAIKEAELRAPPIVPGVRCLMDMRDDPPDGPPVAVRGPECEGIAR